MITISKEYSFDAAHSLWDPGLNPEENLRLFGKCNRVHGHTYNLVVFVTGRVNEDTGMVLNYFDLDKVVKPYVDEVLDHKDLNVVFGDLLTTAENMVYVIAGTISDLLEEAGHWDIMLEAVTLSETPKTSATWTADEVG